MKIPSNMEYDEVVNTINRVCERSAPKYTFYGYERADMIQEAFIICIEALERYDEMRPLENFLAVNLNNRLCNFVRDNHYTAANDPNRLKVYQPAQLQNANNIQNWIDIKLNWLDDIDRTDAIKVIDKKLPASMRLDYLKMQNDVYIPKSRREELIANIQEILENHGYFEER